MRNASALDTAVNIAFLVGAIALLVQYVRRADPGGSTALDGEPAEGIVENWESIRDLGQLIGRRDAPLLIVELGDYECPACRAFHAQIDRLRTRLGDSLALRYVHFPLPSHRNATAAARASVCAADQGMFESYHAALFETPTPLDAGELINLARASGVRDVDRFEKCAADTVPVAAIQSGVAFGTEIRLRRTPTFFINGWRANGAPSDARLDSLVSAAFRRRGALTSR